METIKGWIAKVYADNGLWATLITLLVGIGVLVLLTKLDIQWMAWLK